MSAPLTPAAPVGPTVVQGAARVPQAVREGSPAAKQAYATARGFEQMLLTQMSQSMVSSSGLEGEEAGGGATEEGSGETATGGGAGPESSLLVQAMSEGLMQGGGLGLAAQLTESPARLSESGAQLTESPARLSESAMRQAGTRVTSPSGGTTA